MIVKASSSSCCSLLVVVVLCVLATPRSTAGVDAFSFQRRISSAVRGGILSFRSSPISTVSSSSAATNAIRRIFSSRRSPSLTSLQQSTSDENDGDGDAEQPIDTTVDERLYRIRLPRAPGIEWGTDLSFSFVYARALEPAGPADLSGQVAVNDQLCELIPVAAAADGGDAVEASPISLIGAPFDSVMSAFANLSKETREVDLVFFRGTKDELKELCTGTSAGPADETITITVIQNRGAADETTRQITARAGCNLRQTLVDEGINVYQSVTRWTNCKGKQLCGTCIVNVAEGGTNTNRKSMDEASTLRENPDGYRLSCVTFAYGDVTVETFPPIKAAQWTR